MKTKRPRGRPATGKDPTRSFRAPDAEWLLWQQAAQQSGLTLSAWAREILTRTAKRSLRP